MEWVSSVPRPTSKTARKEIACFDTPYDNHSSEPSHHIEQMVQFGSNLENRHLGSALSAVHSQKNVERVTFTLRFDNCVAVDFAVLHEHRSVLVVVDIMSLRIVAQLDET
jgi:hypothetical protein